MAGILSVTLPNGHTVEIMAPAADYESDTIVVQDDYINSDGKRIIERFEIPVADLPAGGR